MARGREQGLSQLGVIYLQLPSTHTGWRIAEMPLAFRLFSLCQSEWSNGAEEFSLRRGVRW